MMKNLLFYYCLALTIFLTLGTAASAQTGSIVPLILFLPITVYFLSLALGKIGGHRFSFPLQKPLSIAGHYYSFIVIAVMTISGLVGAKNTSQLISGIIFLPLVGYFTLLVFPKKRKAINIPVLMASPKDLDQAKTPSPTKLPKIDVDKRQFLKLISSAGVTLFLFSIFAKKAEAAFFGSVPGPGTIAIKDSTGVVIDPAISTPTDGYKITEVDDASPAYYGFLEKAGKWFIMKETSGAYRYSKGSSGFSTNWTNRASLAYDYFDAVF